MKQVSSPLALGVAAMLHVGVAHAEADSQPEPASRVHAPLPGSDGVYGRFDGSLTLAASLGGDPVRAGRGEWESGYNFDREDRDEEHQRVLGGVLTFDELLAERPRADEAWENTEDSRLGRYARRLWDGLLAHEEQLRARAPLAEDGLRRVGPQRAVAAAARPFAQPLELRRGRAASLAFGHGTPIK